jgi:hypothetical protein
MKGRSGRFPGEETNYTALERARQRTGARPSVATAKPILAPVSYREKRVPSAVQSRGRVGR